MADRTREFGRRMGMFKNLARKPMPRTEIYLKFGYVATERECHLCPRCGNILNAGPDYQPKYCDQCGQKVSFAGTIWKEDKEIGFAKREVGKDAVSG